MLLDSRMPRRIFLLPFAIFLAACGNGSSSPIADSSLDAGVHDASVHPQEPPGDSSPADAGDASPNIVPTPPVADGGSTDSGAVDAGSPDPSPIEIDVPENDVVRFDLLSTERCKHGAPDLFDCVIPNIKIHDPNATRRPTPAMTTLAIKKTGNCSTQYPLELLAESPGMRTTRFNVGYQTIDLNRLDRAPMSKLSLTDNSHWTKFVHVDDTCHLWVEVAMNRSDPI